uniref:Uncharacterized protein n=1 Tax=Arundo donax TaxID=35708 RepID=A0A0A9C020_ARUDO
MSIMVLPRMLHYEITLLSQYVSIICD